MTIRSWCLRASSSSFEEASSLNLGCAERVSSVFPTLSPTQVFASTPLTNSVELKARNVGDEAESGLGGPFGNGS